jgi:hypothetical protein
VGVEDEGAADDFAIPAGELEASEHRADKIADAARSAQPAAWR